MAHCRYVYFLWLTVAESPMLDAAVFIPGIVRFLRLGADSSKADKKRLEQDKHILHTLQDRTADASLSGTRGWASCAPPLFFSSSLLSLVFSPLRIADASISGICGWADHPPPCSRHSSLSLSLSPSPSPSPSPSLPPSPPSSLSRYPQFHLIYSCARLSNPSAVCFFVPPLCSAALELAVGVPS
jgi:hypothetical protein